MEIEKTTLDGLLVLMPRRFGDDRGFFCESWNKQRMAEAGLHYDFVQDNHSLSAAAGTLRGLHYQCPPHSQAKLVRCGRGALYDVAVDIRLGSPSYGQWFGIELSFENGRQLMIPEGFLHGFVTLEPDTEIVYKCSDFYAPDCDGSVAWNDPEIGVDWPLDSAPVLSEKDANAPRLANIGNPFVWEAT
ncbi:dTDP-4-dehydrorhamnose 3,5-epimerase [Sagittula sp. MA-2]|jgi:dTDP-4-dehydrorhamnose 3,5-epimerase|uniref:dTDP-4-dehydrorhamnose 3,5-epimerase n=1 Tax=Sagittula sp. MA-2 TaxID=3048007 RepID=UPI0024C23D41|nr:dTDP-4-dehydrorhamnose 3,5-epimerase [Sagittula sp. MA-2]WHZ37755.1 dTDP-4-dehydrorhamnose 3,5-epimerase [Sagittula sp. MA-2]